MKQQIGSPRWVLLCMVILATALLPNRIFASSYVQRNLVSDVPLLADFTDPNLVNPWGITFSATSPFWLCDQGTGLATVYTASATVAAGTVSATVVTVPATTTNLKGGRCTGQVTNTGGNATAPLFSPAPGVNASFIFSTEDGSISARNGAVGVIKVDNSASGAVYKGLALFNSATANYLYAPNFNSGAIEVYDSNYAKATLPGNFTDAKIPAGYAPFNIQLLNGKLYVTYAKQDAAKKNDVPARGNGYVSVFDTNGNLLQHLIEGGPLNSPWGIQIAPQSFGDFKGALLVGNFGDGLINAFNIDTGASLGTLSAANGNPIINPGLWGLQFGNGGSGGDPSKLYFTAGIGNGGPLQTHGLFGVISLGVNVGAAPIVPQGSVVSGATYAVDPAPVAPGSIAVIFGQNMTDGTSCLVQCGSFDNGTPKRLRTFMNGTQVTVNNNPVPIYYASPGQLAIQIPTDVSGPTASIVVTTNSQPSAPLNVNIAPIVPGIFTVSNDGKGPGVITHNDPAGTLVNANNPARPGETIVIYATGLGQTAPALVTGAAPTVQTNSVTRATVTIDGVPAQVGFSGLAGCCVGLNQINAVVPPNVRSNTNVNVVVNVGGNASNTVTMPTGAPLPPSFNLNGTAASLNGQMPGFEITGILLGIFNPTVGNVPIVATGVSSGGQTVYSGGGSGSGTLQCPGGSQGNWTANVSAFTATVSPAVVAGGGPVTGTWSATVTGSACGGASQTQTWSGPLVGNVNPAGNINVNFAITGGPGGGGGNNNPVVLTGTATLVTGTLSGSDLFDPGATGSLAISATGVTSGNQTVYTASGSGSGTARCPNGSTGNWTATLTATATVTPAIPSLGANGGSLSGTWSATFTGTLCGSPVSDGGNGTISGNVSASGAVTLNLNESGGGGNPVSVTGTAASVSGPLPATEFLRDSTATGSIAMSGTGVSSASQTVYTVTGSGSGTAKCPDGSTGNWTGSINATITVTPAVPSLATSGGNVTGSFSGTLSRTLCGSSQDGPANPSVDGTVSAGGAVTLNIH